MVPRDPRDILAILFVMIGVSYATALGMMYAGKGVLAKAEVQTFSGRVTPIDRGMTIRMVEGIPQIREHFRSCDEAANEMWKKIKNMGANDG